MAKRKVRKKRSKKVNGLEHCCGRHETAGLYLSEFVYGAIDGTITTFAVVAGVTGAALSPMIVVILGVANLIADGFSMGCSSYLSGQAQSDYIKKERKREMLEVKTIPETERAEVRAIMRRKGFVGKNLDRAVAVITSNKKVWVDTMMADELGLVESSKSPIKTAAMTFFGFLVIGVIPLLAYLLAFWFPLFRINTFEIACLLTFVALFIVGAIKKQFTQKSLFRSAFETVSVGGIAAVIAYYIGYVLRLFNRLFLENDYLKYLLNFKAVEVCNHLLGFFYIQSSTILVSPSRYELHDL